MSAKAEAQNSWRMRAERQQALLRAGEPVWVEDERMAFNSIKQLRKILSPDEADRLIAWPSPMPGALQGRQIHLAKPKKNFEEQQ